MKWAMGPWDSTHWGPVKNRRRSNCEWAYHTIHGKWIYGYHMFSDKPWCCRTHSSNHLATASPRAVWTSSWSSDGAPCMFLLRQGSINTLDRLKGQFETFQHSEFQYVSGGFIYSRAFRSAERECAARGLGVVVSSCGPSRCETQRARRFANFIVTMIKSCPPAMALVATLVCFFSLAGAVHWKWRERTVPCGMTPGQKSFRPPKSARPGASYGRPASATMIAKAVTMRSAIIITSCFDQSWTAMWSPFGRKTSMAVATSWCVSLRARVRKRSGPPGSAQSLVAAFVSRLRRKQRSGVRQVCAGWPRVVIGSLAERVRSKMWTNGKIIHGEIENL